MIAYFSNDACRQVIRIWIRQGYERESMVKAAKRCGLPLVADDGPVVKLVKSFQFVIFKYNRPF